MQTLDMTVTDNGCDVSERIRIRNIFYYIIFLV